MRWQMKQITILTIIGIKYMQFLADLISFTSSVYCSQLNWSNLAGLQSLLWWFELCTVIKNNNENTKIVACNVYNGICDTIIMRLAWLISAVIASITKINCIDTTILSAVCSVHKILIT